MNPSPCDKHPDEMPGAIPPRVQGDLRLIRATLAEGRSASGSKPHALICRMLREICQAPWVALATWDEAGREVCLEALAGSPELSIDLTGTTAVRFPPKEADAGPLVSACTAEEPCLACLFRLPLPGDPQPEEEHACFNIDLRQDAGRPLAIATVHAPAMSLHVPSEVLLTAMAVAEWLLSRPMPGAAADGSVCLHEMLIDGSIDALLIHDNGRILFANQRISEMLGRDLDEIMRNSIFELVAPEERERAKRLHEEQMTMGNQPITNEVTVQDAQGERIPTEITGRGLEFRGRRVALVEIRDIRQRKLVEHQLTQAQKMESIGLLAGGIAHEINTPTQYVGDNLRFLRDILGDLTTLISQYQGVLTSAKEGSLSADTIAAVERGANEVEVSYVLEEAPRAIQESLDGIQRVTEIVRAMRDFSQPGQKHRQAVDLNAIIGQAVTLSRNEWKYVADTELALDAALPTVTCIPGAINQVVLNLIINAADAVKTALGANSSDRGLISISTRADGDWAEIRIRDTGCGISAENISRVYDPFFTTKEVGRGSGQGLAMAHQVIAKQHYGSIEIESQVGSGTTIVVRIPVATTDEKVA